MESQNTQVPTLEEIVQLMNVTLKGGNNESMGLATKRLKHYTKDIASMQPLINLLINANDVGLRQLSAVLLKRNINTHYLTMEPNDRKFLKQTILDRYFAETQRPVRRALGFLIGVLTKVTLPQNDWAELLEIISQRTNDSQTVETRENAIYLLDLILNISGEHLESHFTDFYTFFSNTIQDPVKQIRYESLKCILHLWENLSDNEHLKLFSTLVEPVLKVVNECIDDRQDELVHTAFGVFCDLAEVESPIFNEKIYTAMILFICSERVLLNTNLEATTREVTIEFLADIAKNHRQVLAKNQEILQTVVNTMCLLTLNKSKDEKLDDGDTIQDIALQMIMELSLQIAKKKLYPLLKKNVVELVQSGDPWKLEAALFILAYISEGCCEYVKRDLANPIMTSYVPNALASEVPEVRAAGIYAICYFAENLCPDILMYHKMILPALVKASGDSDGRVAQRALFTIDLFCENMEEEIVEYVDELVPRLLTILDNQASTMYMRRLCISAISSIIQSSEAKFIPHIAKVAPLMGQLIAQIQPPSELLCLRAEATSCLGRMAHLLRQDKESFIRFVQPFVDTIWVGLQNVKDPEIREHSFAFFYNVAHCLKADFQPYLAPMMELVYSSIQSNEGYEKKKPTVEYSLDTDSEDEDDTSPDFYPAGSNVKMEFLEEKSAAIHAMGEFAKACPMQFVPYFDRCFKTLDDVTLFWYANIRMQVSVCYKNLLEGLLMASNDGKIPEYQCGLPCLKRFPEKVEEFIHIEYYTKVIHYLVEDESYEVTSATLEQLCDATKKFGPAFVDKSIDRLMEALNDLLLNKGVCQKGEEDDSDDVDVNGLIFGNITDLLPILAKVLGDGFMPKYQVIHNTFKKFLKENKGLDDITQTVGTYGECFKHVPSLIGVYHADLLPAILKTVEMNEEMINRNVAYTCGVFVAHGKELIVPYYTQILKVLKHIFDLAIDRETKDNAVSAIAKIIYTSPDKVPLDFLIPTVMAEAPFTGDLKEVKTLVRMILFLLETQPQALTGHEEKAIMVLIDAVVNWKKYSLKEKYIKACGVTLKNLGGSNEQIKKIIEQSATKLEQNDYNFLLHVMN